MIACLVNRTVGDMFIAIFLEYPAVEDEDEIGQDQGSHQAFTTNYNVS